MVKKQGGMKIMRNKSPKIAKLLYDANKKRAEALNLPKSEKYVKKYAKKLNAAEKLSRKALELTRADISKAVNNGFNDLICSVYNLAAVLYIQERFDEAVPLLEEARAASGFDGHMYSVAINSYYGCILCAREDYDRSGEVLDTVMADAEKNEYMAFTDAYALAQAYGDAACAFTYADTGVGYPAERFSEPVERLFEMKEKGYSIDGNLIKKAAYFSASQKLYYMCFGAPTASDPDDTIKTASLCLQASKEAGVVDFFTPAAMRIIALATARNLMFGDCADICEKILDHCARFGSGIPESPYGSVQDIAADANLLLGIMHYRADHYEISVKYFQAALAALEADAHGRPLAEVGYVEVEAIVIAVSSAEKAAFACKYIGLAMRAMDEQYSLGDCVDMMKKGIEHINSISDDPYFALRASSEYNIISKFCKDAGDLQSATKYEELSKKYGYYAMTSFEKSIEDRELYDKYLKVLQSRKRLALRRGLLEQYAECLRCEIMLSDLPYKMPDMFTLVELNNQMGEYCRITDRYDSAVEYFDKVREYTYDQNGEMREELKKYVLSENSMLSQAASLVKLERMDDARESFREFIKIDTITSGGELSLGERMRIARLARNIGLNSAECAEYMHEAAVMSAETGDEPMHTAGLYNQEGVCWYNASPEKDDPDDDCNCDECAERCDQFEPMAVRYARLSEKFAERELEAFEKSYSYLVKCDPKEIDVIDLMPSLMSNIGECHMRRGNVDTSIEYYQKAVEAFETLFAAPEFAEREEDTKNADIFQYGVCFKSMGELYEKKNDAERSIESFGKAIDVFAKIDNPSARYNLGFCLNARGCMNYRMGRYSNEVEDITRAIDVRSGDEDSEITLAIMLKNRAEAYESMGNYRSMKNDLEQSIAMLDKSKAPREMLHSMYGEHLFSLALCHEELNDDGSAAESYRKALTHLDAVQSEDEDDFGNIDMRALCHLRRANCLFRRDEREYYGALAEYDRAIQLLDELPPSVEKNERLKAALLFRGRLYEQFREIDLAREDYERIEQINEVLAQNSSN